MDSSRLEQFSAFEPDVFASFVADLFERAGYDCRLVTPASNGGPNLVADRESGGRIRIAAVASGAVDDIGEYLGTHGSTVDDILNSLGARESAVDIVAIPQASAPDRLRLSRDVELFDGERLAAFVDDVGAEGLVDDYLFGRDAARERVDGRRAGRPMGSGATTDGESASTEPQKRPDFTRGRAYTLVVVGIVGLCFGTSLADSVGGGVAVVVLNGSYLLLVGGMFFDARSLRYRTLDGAVGMILTSTVGILLLLAVSRAPIGSVAGVGYLASRWRLERTAAPGTDFTWSPLGHTHWYWLVVAGTAGWVVTLVGILGGGKYRTMTFSVALGSWLAVPIGLTVDGRHKGQPFDRFTSQHLALAALVPPLGVVVGAVYSLSQRDVSAEQLREGFWGSAPGVSRIHTWFNSLLTSASVAFTSVVDTVRQSFDRDDSGGPSHSAKLPHRSQRPAHDEQSVPESREGDSQRTVGPDTADPDPSPTATTPGETAADGTTEADRRVTDDPVAVDGNTDRGDTDDVPSGEYTLGPPVSRPPRESRRVGYDGEQFTCTSVASRNGRWRVAWGDPSDSGAESNERVFLLQYEARQLSVGAVGVEECAVGDDGTVALVEFDGDGDGVSRLRVFSATGETVLDRAFDGEIRAVTVAGDREPTVVGAGLRSPDRLVVFDGETGVERLSCGLDVEPDAIEFRESNGDRWVVVNRPAQPTPAVAVRVRDGTVAR